MHLRQVFPEYFSTKQIATALYTSSVNLLQYIDANHLETIADINLKALHIMDLLKFGVKHILVKLQTLAVVGIHAEMQFLAYCASLGISMLRMHILNFVFYLYFTLCTIA